VVVGDRQVQAVEQAAQFSLRQLPQALPEDWQPIKRRHQNVQCRHGQAQLVVQLGQRCLVVGDGLLQFGDAAGDVTSRLGMRSSSRD
jgi:hypothetical protein